MSRTVEKLARIPGRCRRDLRTILLLRNWREALAAEWTGAPLEHLRFRSGAVIRGPEASNLNFLFYEIYLQQIYAYRSYSIKRGDTVIDVGANIGVFSIYAAECARGGRVYAFEPNPESLRYLKKNVDASRLGNVVVFPTAVAGGTGERLLHVRPGNLLVSSLARGSPGDGEIRVRCVSLDEVMEVNGITQCDLLKLDCEGSEYEILQNCSPKTLGRVERIVGEFHEGPDISGTGDGLCRFLRSRSFRVDHFERLGPTSGVFCARNLASRDRGA
jgi:FkbM family methyltransferase